MKIIVINKGTGQVPLPDSTTLKAGEEKTMTGRTIAEVQMLNGYQSDNVFVRSELEAVDRAPIVAEPLADVTATSGATTRTLCGCQLVDQAGGDAGVAPQLYVGVFADAECTVLAGTATLDTAGSGTIDDGAGEHLLKVTPDATGEVSLTMTNAVDEDVYLKCWAVNVDYSVDSAEKQTVTFEA